MKKLNFTLLACFVFATSLFFSSCKKKSKDPEPEVIEPKAPPIPIPVFGGSLANMVDDTSRISMIKRLMDYAHSGNTSGTVIDNTKLTNMYTNTNNPFIDTKLNSKTGVNISMAVNPMYKDTIPAYFTRLANASKAVGVGMKDKAGVINYQSGNYSKLFDEKGFAIDELIEKSLAGSVQLYQMCAVYLTDVKLTSSDVNSNLKNWDFAYAQLGVPLDYGNKDYYYSIQLWGKYLKVNDQKLGSISKILNAFVAGRQAIVDKDNVKVMANATIIKNEMETATAGMVITSLYNTKYYNERNAVSEKNRSLTEAYGFLQILNNHPTKKISTSKLDGLLKQLSLNNYTISMATVDSIIADFGIDYPNVNTNIYIDPNL